MRSSWSHPLAALASGPRDRTPDVVVDVRSRTVFPPVHPALAYLVYAILRRATDAEPPNDAAALALWWHDGRPASAGEGTRANEGGERSKTTSAGARSSPSRPRDSPTADPGNEADYCWQSQSVRSRQSRTVCCSRTSCTSRSEAAAAGSAAISGASDQEKGRSNTSAARSAPSPISAPIVIATAVASVAPARPSIPATLAPAASTLNSVA